MPSQRLAHSVVPALATVQSEASRFKAHRAVVAGEGDRRREAGTMRRLAIASFCFANLSMADASGTPRATFGVGTDGGATLGFFDPRRNLRARFALRGDAVPALDIFDDAQRVRPDAHRSRARLG